MTDSASSMRHSEQKIDTTDAAHHIVSVKVYTTVFITLLFLTVLTVWVAYYNFGGLINLILAMGIATVKALCVALWFMHVAYSGKLIRIVIVTSLLFLSLMIFGTLMDVWTRSNVTPGGYVEDVYQFDNAVAPASEAAPH